MQNQWTFLRLDLKRTFLKSTLDECVCEGVHEYVNACVCMCVCVRACVRACVCMKMDILHMDSANSLLFL